MNKLIEAFKSIEKHKNILHEQLKNKTNYYYNKYKDINSKYHNIDNREKDTFTSDYYYTASELKQIDIDIAQGNIELILSKQNNVKISLDAITFQDKEEWPNAEEYFFKESILDIQNEVLEVKVPSNYIQVNLKIEVPSKIYQNISINVKCGDIKVKELSCNYLFCKSINGNFNITKLEAKFCDVNTANGMVNLKDTRVESIKVNTINGNISFEGFSNKLKFETINGFIDLINYSVELTKLSAYTINGQISILLPKELEFTLKAQAKNGIIKHDLPLDFLKKSAQIPSTNEVETMVVKSNNVIVDLQTKNGNIKVFRKES